jgi:CHAT domain-containing protein
MAFDLARSVLPIILALYAVSDVAWGASEAVAPGKAVSTFDKARARQQDSETLRSLTDEGRLLYQKDRIKLDGFQYCGQAIALAERGEFRQSIQAASKALIIGQQQNNGKLVASAKRDLAITYSYAGDLEQAAHYAREALAEPDGAAPAIAGPSLKTLGDVYARKGNYAEAINYYQKAETAASDKFRPLVAISLANAYMLNQQLAESRSLYQRIGQPDATLRSAFQRGLANLSLAEKDYPAALKLFTAVVNDAAGSDAAYHRLWGQEGVARTLLLMNDKAGARNAYLAAVQTSETIRTRFRSEEFKVGLFGDVQQIFDRAIALSMDAGDHAGAWALSEQSRSRALLDIVRDRVALRVTAAPPDTAPMAVATAGAVLRQGEAIVQFHTLDEQVLAWVIRPGGVRGYRIERSRKDLAADVDAFRQAIFTRSAKTRESGERLHALLIAPLQLAPGEQLLIVPHDSLHYLPFQALRGADGYLIERHALAFAPSASVALQLVKRSAVQGGRLVAFGNPGTDEKLALPNAEREVSLIAGLFPDRQIFMRADASKRQFRDSVNSAGILHVAAHAEVDVIDPLQSRILLAPEGNDLGFLEAREVYGLNLDKVSLVTLSACESGLGRIARGDEIMGFTRSFLTAGASGLLVSLWPVADDSTEMLMTTLYGELAKGKPAAVAMQTAQIAVLKRARFSHPFFWAPFDLVGDWRMQIRTDKSI